MKRGENFFGVRHGSARAQNALMLVSGLGKVR